jgi:GR25 family glycosyltransferase involved in LPS biosynthesis
MNLFKETYPKLTDKLYAINNGIEIEKFIYNRTKIENRFIYSSCSERGLDRLLELWPEILKELPNSELFICSYNKFPHNDYENNLKNIIDQYESVKHVGCLNKSELYELMSTSEYWLYPTNFSETSCITSMELLMSDVICLYYPLAGLVNTIGDYGIPISRGNEIETLINLTNKRKSEIKRKGREYALTCSWENRAKTWCELFFFNKIINEPTLTVEKNNIKVVNLKRREDRKNHFIEQFEREGIASNQYEFKEAVDGNELNETTEIQMLFGHNNFGYRKGVIGCSLSHLNIYNDLINDFENDFYIIFEDDVELVTNFKEKLNKITNEFTKKNIEHLAISLSLSNSESEINNKSLNENEINIYEKDVYKLWNITFAYIISKDAAKKIINFVNKCSIKCAWDNPQAYGEIIKYHYTTTLLAKHPIVEIVGSDILHNYDRLNFKNNISKYNLKISFCDWWYQEYCGGNFDFKNNFITDILKKYGNLNELIVVNPNENPDILFYSIFGDEHMKYNNVRRVFYSGEPFGIRNEADYNLTFDRNDDKNTRYPLWLSYLNDYLLEECQRRKNGIVNIPKRENFCSFIAAGEVKTTHRRTIVQKLSQYKKVHCGGKYLNNIGYTIPRGVNCSGKIEHNNKYKFAIAFENEDYPGYVTEKICDIYKSNCVPIYWGADEVVDDFPADSFINVNTKPIGAELPTQDSL